MIILEFKIEIFKFYYLNFLTHISFVICGGISNQTADKYIENTLQITPENFYNNENDYQVSFCPEQCSCLDDYFECKRLNLKKIPLLPDWVGQLDLTGNGIESSVKNPIKNLPNLISLSLKKNRLRKLPSFVGLNKLEKLNLAHNKIQLITIELFMSLTNLKELDLSRNRIKVVLLNSFPPKNRLTKLNLSFNRLNIIEDASLDHLDNLVELQLSHNNLFNLPTGVFKSLNNLEKLDLSNNSINISYSMFKGLDELKVLKLRSNNIRYLPDRVFHLLKNIDIIELDSNLLTVINKQGFVNLTSLTTISLSNNSLNDIEVDTWEYTPQLMSLNLSYNNLTHIKIHHLKCLTKLKKLNLSKNNLKNIVEGSFNCTKNLEQLDLSNNKLFWIIENIPNMFSVLKKLNKLNLNDNNIKSINQNAFNGLESLEIINLDKNNITTIQLNAFEPLKKLQNLKIHTKNFLCDCYVKWLYNWFKSTKHIIVGQIICDYPMNLHGKSFLSSKEEDLICNESPKPSIIKEPSNQLAIKGTNVILECSAISLVPSDITVSWRRDNIEVRANDIQKINSNSSKITTSYLYLYNVNHDHSGRYQCAFTNSFGTAYSQRFKITVATYPEFRKTPSNVTINSGSTARLDCSAFGEPIPQIAWQKDGGNDFPAARERRMHVMPTDDAFFIINANVSDMGVYTCTAENPAGIIKANATLTVYESPSFIKPVENEEVVIGKKAILECRTTGSPTPSLKWSKDDKPLQITERHYFAAGNELLIITDVILSDAGKYKCEINNELGNAVAQITLKVNKAANRNVVNVEEITGIVIITVFCCAVGTSIIWVVIIYQYKKANECNNNINNNNNNNDILDGNTGNFQTDNDITINVIDNNTENVLTSCINNDNSDIIIATTTSNNLMIQSQQLLNTNVNNKNSTIKKIEKDENEILDNENYKTIEKCLSKTSLNSNNSSNTSCDNLSFNNFHLQLNEINNCHIHNIKDNKVVFNSGINSNDNKMKPPLEKKQIFNRKNLNGIIFLSKNNDINQQQIDDDCNDDFNKDILLQSSMPLISNINNISNYNNKKSPFNENSIHVPDETITFNSTIPSKSLSNLNTKSIVC